MPIQVEKKDGRKEPFDRNKVSAGVTKSGATPEQADSIASQIETWAQGTAVDGVIKASDIRTKVLELLRTANPQAAGKFEAYKKA